MVSVLSVLFGLFAFFAITGGAILKPEYIDWLMSNIDSAKDFLGWQFFRNLPFLQFPPGANPNYGADLGNSIVYSDSIPLLAFLFKLLDPFLPYHFQYFGLWILFCFVLQSFFAYRLLVRFTTDKWLPLIGSGFFTLAPVFLCRLSMHHNALVGQWLVLTGFYVYFAKRFSVWLWITLLSAALLIHAYLFAMVFVIWSADLWQRCWHREINVYQVLAFLLVVGFIVVILMWLAGYFMVSGGVVGEGFGYYRMNILSLIDPNAIWSKIIQDQPNGPGDYEGFNYIGLGIMLLSIITGYEFLRKPYLKLNCSQFVPLLTVSLILTGFALSNRLAFGQYELFVYPIPSIFDLIVNIFRSSGRLFWPVYYLIYLVILGFIFSRLERRVAISVCALALIFQIADSWSALLNLRKQFDSFPKWSSPLRSPLWSKIGEHYQRVIYVLPRNAPDAFMPWAYFAAEHRMAINFGYFARVDPIKLNEERKQIAKSIIDGKFDPKALYVFEDLALWHMAINQQAVTSDVAGVLDGFRVLAPRLEEYSDCDLNAITRVYTNQEQLYYSLGESVTFSQGGVGSKYLVFGWSQPESWGTWSEGDESWLVLELADKPKQDLILRLQGHAFINDKHPSQEIEIWVNGQLIGVLLYRLPARVEEWKMVIPKALIQDHLVRLRLLFKNPISPREVGINADGRRLGLGLIALQLEAKG